MRPEPRVCVVGSINVDLVVRAPRLPAAGETVIGAGYAQHPGGKGANQAVAARRSGGAGAAMIGAVGDDAHGRLMLDVLAADGVDVAGVQTRPDAATGVALITVDAAGENTIVVASGANALLTPEQVDRRRGAIESADVTLAVLEVPVDAVAAAAEIARTAGRRFVLNAAPAMRVPPTLLRQVTVLVANQTEAATLAEHTGADLGTVTRALLALGPAAVAALRVL